MAITNASTITASDLNNMTTAAQALLQTDNAQLPLCQGLCFTFADATAALLGTNPERFKSVFVVPYDCLIEAVCVVANDFTVGSTVTVTMASAGILDSFPVEITGVTATAAHKFGRTHFNNTKGRVGTTYMTANQATRVLLKGSTVTLSFTTTSVTAANRLQVTVLLRSFFARS